MRADGLAALDNRSREIFRRIVELYLETGDPVGSRNLSRILATALSPASVRNVMADLEDLGLIYAPHTSAGRLPTELGLRFFINSVMEVGDLSPEERQRIDSEVRGNRAMRIQSRRCSPMRVICFPRSRAVPAWYSRRSRTSA